MFLPSNITLKLGDSGDFVAELQRRLAARNFLSDDMISGLYDGATVVSVRQFQGAHGIRADGVAGPETLRRLNGLVGSNSSSTDSSSSGSEDQASSITLADQNRLQWQYDQEELRKQELIEQQAALQQSQQDNPPKTEQNKAEQLTETKKQLPGGDIGRDQHLSRSMAPVDILALQLAQQQQAFIDRPITQTLTPSPETDVAKSSPEIGDKRGLATGNTSEQSLASQSRYGADKSLTNVGLDPTNNEKSSPEAGTNAVARAPLRIQSPTQLASGEFIQAKHNMESKLAPHVIEEVKQVGVVMVNHGVRGGQNPVGTSAPERTPGMEEQRQVTGGGGRGQN
jgi:peptidoglycan hydrolase-like protein with peptidoglycan-binding domain